MTKLDQMWVALAKYQSKADEKGHGVSWAKMCELKTERAADAAAIAVSWVDVAEKAAYWAANYASVVVSANAFQVTGRADCVTQQAIDHINKALGETE